MSKVQFAVAILGLLAWHALACFVAFDNGLMAFLTSTPILALISLAAICGMKP